MLNWMPIEWFQDRKIQEVCFDKTDHCKPVLPACIIIYWFFSKIMDYVVLGFAIQVDSKSWDYEQDIVKLSLSTGAVASAT